MTKSNLSNIHVYIGLFIMAVFWILPPIEPITVVGMRCLGIFIGSIYLWSTVSVLWPSLLAITLIGLSGYAAPGFSGFIPVLCATFGNDVVLQTLFILILFGALDEYGCTRYIAEWFLTRKIFRGRPYMFIAVFYLACWAISMISAMTALFPSSVEVL